MKKIFLAIFAWIAFSQGASYATLIDLNAIGATATASRSYQSSVAENAIDGDLYTEWNSGTHGTISSPQWIKVDLGKRFTVSQISLFSFDNIGTWESYWIGYDLYASLDGNTWGSPIATGTLLDLPAPNFYDNVVFNELIELQYIWVNETSGNHWAHLRELQIYGDATVAAENIPVPEPNTMFLLGSGFLGLIFLKKKISVF